MATVVPISLVLADDHKLVRQSLLQILGTKGRFDVLSDVSNGADALVEIRSREPDVAVLDISMPGPNGIEIAETLRNENSKTSVLILTMHNEPALVRRALSAGARGVILKDDAVEDLVYAIGTVARDGTYMSPSLAADAVGVRHEQDLSARETEALQMVVDGLTSKEIAAKMAVGTKTVDTYRARAAQKLGARNGAELVREAIRQGLVRSL